MMWIGKALRSCLVSGLALLVAQLGMYAQVSVTTYHNDNARTGQNTNETVLTPSNVIASKFGKVFTQKLDGEVYVQPLYIPNVTIPGKGVHNVVYVATEHDTVYAFDADSNTGANASPLWYVSFVDPANGITTIPSTDFGTDCTDLTPEVGITGTPVIDSSTGTLYLLARTKENFNYVDRLHALDITTGSEKFGGPVEVRASVPGIGDGGTDLVLNTFTQNQRVGLVLQSGTVYIGFSVLCSAEPFHGWLLGYDAQTLQQKAAWTSTANGRHGGVWAGGAAPAGDNNSNLFLATGEGTFDANTGGRDYGSSVVRLAAPGNVTNWGPADFFTPYNQANLFKYNLDLGSGGVVLLPDQPVGSPHLHLLMIAGKSGTIYLLNRDQLGQYNASGDTQVVQALVGALGGQWGSPSWWNNYAFFSGPLDVVKRFTFDPIGGLLSTVPTASSVSTYQYINGSSPGVSSNGARDGIVWTAENHLRKAILHAYDASNLNELYNTTQNPTRDSAGAGVRFMVPTVVNGKVYFATNFALGVYGLLPLVPANLSFPVQLAGTISSTHTVTLTNPTPTTLNFTGITLSGEFIFSPNGTCPLSGGTLAPAMSCTIEVAFAVDGAGTETGVLTITAPGYPSPLQMNLSGTGKSVTFSPMALTWGNITLFQSSAPKLLTVSILGTDPTTFSSIAVGTDRAEFAIASNTCVGSIVGPSQCALYLTFTPQATGTRTGTLNFNDTSGNQTINLSGTGEGLSQSPTSLGFGSVAVGSKSAPKTLSLSVLGTNAATFGSLSFGGTDPGDYGLVSDGCSGKMIFGGSSCQMQVVFSPTATGSRPATMLIPNNDGANPFTVKVSGTGQ